MNEKLSAKSMLNKKYDNPRHFLSEFQMKIVQDKYSLTQIEKSNILSQNIARELGVTNKNIKDLNALYTLVSKLKNAISNKKIMVKNQRREILQTELQKHLKYLFPEENFDIKIKSTIYRGKEHCDLLLARDGIFLPIKGQNGRMARQVIAVTCLYVINKLKGSRTLFMDEAFCCGDLDTISSLTPVIEKILKDGMQIIMVDNTHKTYENLTRRVFNLEKDRVNDELLLKGVDNFESEGTGEYLEFND